MRFPRCAAVPVAFLASTHPAAALYVCSFDVMCAADGECHQREYEFVIVEGSEVSSFRDDSRSVQVMNLYGSQLTSFIEFNSRGDVMSVSIANDGTAVYSKNASLLGALVAVQYHGVCEKG